MTDQTKRVTIDVPDGPTILAARHLDATEGPVQVGATVTTATRSAIDRVLSYVAKAHNSTAADTPASTAPAAAAHPIVRGRCPACRGQSLFLGSGGHITCARLDCPNPCAADDQLHADPTPEPAATQATKTDGDPDTRCGDPYRTEHHGVARCSRGLGHAGIHAGHADDGAPMQWQPEPDATDQADPELTAEEARALADELGTQLYRAQDALAYVAECCDIADREGRQPTTDDVREWLKGARCGRQLAGDKPDLVRDLTAAVRERQAAPDERGNESTASPAISRGQNLTIAAPAAVHCSHLPPDTVFGWCGVCNHGTAAPTEPDTITDPAWLRQQYAAAMLNVIAGPPPRILPPDTWQIIDDLATAVHHVRDRHLQQLRQRLTLADAELQQWAAAESADAAAGSYAGRAEEAEAVIERVRALAVKVRDRCASGSTDHKIGKYDMAIAVLNELDQQADQADVAS